MNDERDLRVKCDEKWTMIFQRIRSLKPFYHAIFTSLPKLGYDSDSPIMEKYGESRLAVTAKEIVFNREFVANAPVDEMVFDTLHIITHYALLHVERRGRVKYPEVYSIAADLYVNALLVAEYNLTPGEVTKTSSNVKISMPMGRIIYDQNINIQDVCVEDIYQSLLKYGMSIQKKNGENMKFDGSEAIKNDDIGRSRVGNKDNPIEESENLIKAMMTNRDILDNMDKIKGIISDLMGKVMTGASDGEIKGILDSANLSDTDMNTMEQYMKNQLLRAMVEGKMAGNGSGSILEEYVNKIIAPKVDWRKLLRKHLVQLTSKESSYSKVDKRTLWHGAILPGQDTPDDLRLQNIYMCVDTSGSISHDDLEIVYAQLAQLCKTYKVDGKLVHWDTDMNIAGDIQNPNSLYKTNAVSGIYGRGGTDPSCLFKYFDSKECKKKPAVVVILTDGYISFRKENLWEKKYGKKTVWLIAKNGFNKFEAPFGTVCNLANN